MGLRTHWRGIIYARAYKAVFAARTADNLYTSYGYLRKVLGSDLGEKVKENLRRKVEDGYISLEELTSGGRATQLFREAGLFDEAAAELAAKRAAVLTCRDGSLQKLILSGKRVAPYIVEHLSERDVAMALCLVSKPVWQRSVSDLKEVSRIQASDTISNVLIIDFVMEYEDKKIITQYFPGRIGSVFCHEREAARVRSINRGVVITDRFVSNATRIFDALSEFKISPLDHVLIFLRGVQGLLYPTSPLLISSYPQPRTDELISRDHFTENARGVLHQAVEAEFNRMEAEGGNPLSFRVYIRRNNEHYGVEISWNK